MTGQKRSQKGFTIIELMIATSVVSVLLLLATVIIIGIGNLYYKGISQSRVQDNVRSIADEISQQLRFSDQLYAVDSPSGAIHAICIGKTRYTYTIGHQVGSDPNPPNFQSPHVLWRE